jgi:hypothetical protein
MKIAVANATMMEIKGQSFHTIHTQYNIIHGLVIFLLHH